MTPPRVAQMEEHDMLEQRFFYEIGVHAVRRAQAPRTREVRRVFRLLPRRAERPAPGR